MSFINIIYLLQSRYMEQYGIKSFVVIFFHCTYFLSLFYHSVHKVQNVDSVFTEHFLNPQFPFEMRKTRADRYWFSDPRVPRVAPIKEILYSCSPPPSSLRETIKFVPASRVWVSWTFQNSYLCIPPRPQITFATINQLEKLEAAKAAWLVYLSLLSLTGSFLALLVLT